MLGARDDREHERGHADRRQQRADQVRTVRPGGAARGSGGGHVAGRGLRLGHEDHHGGQAERRDRQVDQEDRAPPEVVQHEAAEQGARGKAERVDRAPYADRLRMLVRSEDLHHDGQCRGEQQRSAHAHAGPRGDQLPGGVGKSGHQRSSAEQHEPRDQHLLAAVAIGRAACGEQQPRLYERVGVDRKGGGPEHARSGPPPTRRATRRAGTHPSDHRAPTGPSPAYGPCGPPPVSCRSSAASGRRRWPNPPSPS